MDAREALQLRSERKLDDIDLLRVLVTHETWRVPSFEEDGKHQLLLRNVGDQQWLEIFTDEEALTEHLRVMGQETAQPWVATTGEWLFSSVGEPLAGIAINPDLPGGLRFAAEHFPLLRAWATSLKVERVLAEHRDDEADMILLASARFYVAMADDGSGNGSLALAPDEPGRKLAAVFTAPDAARTYAEAAAEGLGRELVVRIMNGAALFSSLSELELDGLVFNCMGPTRPVALGIGFTEAFAQAMPTA